MNFDEQLERFEQKQGGATTDTIEAVETESVITAEVVEEVAPTENNNVAEEVITPVTPELQQPDYNKFLEESSDGLFKTVDEFKANLEKVKSYDQLKAEKEQFEAKANENPFANDFVKKYNELVKSGKTQDQIDSFVKINQLGDLSQLDPFALKVENLVQQGYKRDVAERKVNRDFNLNIDVDGEYLTDEEIATNKSLLEDAKEELRISSKADLASLEELKVKLSDTQDNNAHNKILAEEAQLKTYQQKLKPITDKIAGEYKGLGTLNVNGGEGDKAKYMNFEVEPEYKQHVEQRLYEYFQDGKTPVNEQTVAEARVAIDANWLYDNKEKFAQINYNQGIADAKLSAIAEFENKSGLPTSGLAPITKGAEASLRGQQRKVALGLDD